MANATAETRRRVAVLGGNRIHQSEYVLQVDCRLIVLRIGIARGKPSPAHIGNDDPIAMLQMRREVWAGLRESRRENLQAVQDINSAVAGKPAGDPAFASALDELGASRRARQEKMLAPVIAFRDGLSPASRERFVLMSKDPQFMLELFGLRLDADAR